MGEYITNNDKMLVDIQYVKRNKALDLPDYIYTIWKDLKTGEKKLLKTENPNVIIYFEKDEIRRTHTYSKNHEYKKNLLPVTVGYKDIIYAIAKDMGPTGEQKLNNCFETRNYEELKWFYMYPYVYGADYDIRPLYRLYWKKKYGDCEIPQLTYGFSDIEVDGFEAVGLPNASVNPVDLITIIDCSTNKSYTFCLIGVGPNAGETNQEKLDMYAHRKEQQDYWSTHIDELKKEAHKMFDESYPDMEYNFYFYKDEAKMIVHYFELVNQLKLDFLEFWNISFDIPYLIQRCKSLGLDPAEVMCPKDFPSKECWFKEDRNHFDIKNKTDFFHITSYTIYSDQMRNYAAIRKGQSELRSFRLNYIAEKEIGDSKLNYSDNGNIKTVSYNNYLMYILYNIKDVLLQKGIEEKTDDLMTYYMGSYENITPYENEFKQTEVLRNVQYMYYDQEDMVPGENINIMNNKSSDEEDEESSFEGALVGNPKLKSKNGAKIYGRPTNSVFNFNIDMDMKAFYPMTNIANNVDPSTLEFKVFINAEQFDCRGGELHYHGITDVQLVKKNDDSFNGDIAKEVLDNFQTGNVLSTGRKWLNLPSVNDIYKELERRYNNG